MSQPDFIRRMTREEVVRYHVLISEHVYGATDPFPIAFEVWRPVDDSDENIQEKAMRTRLRTEVLAGQRFANMRR